MQISLAGTGLTLLAFLNVYIAQAVPSPLIDDISNALNGASRLVGRGTPKAGDTNCHGSGACPILERNLFRAVKVRPRLTLA